MKSNFIKTFALTLSLAIASPISAQFNLTRIISAGKKAIQAATLTDTQMAAYVKESVDYMDANNKVASADDPYTKRLLELTDGLNDVNGIPLNFKVYLVTDINAFACADGSVRVFSSLMDIMNDDELLGIIGHEVGHVAKHHSKNAFKNELLGEAITDVIASTGDTAAKLTESQLSKLSKSLINAKYSQSQENEADDYGYEFLKSHGKNPWGIVQAFEKLQAMESESGSQSSYLAKMFSSHPDTKERIKRMSERCLEDGIPRPATRSISRTVTKK